MTVATKIKTRFFDPAEMLDTPEARASFLSLALADGDPAEIKDAISIVARAHGMTQVAKAAGLGRSSLYRALSEDGNPEFTTILRVLSVLGLELRATPKAARKHLPTRSKLAAY